MTRPPGSVAWTKLTLRLGQETCPQRLGHAPAAPQAPGSGRRLSCWRRVPLRRRPAAAGPEPVWVLCCPDSDTDTEALPSRGRPPNPRPGATRTRDRDFESGTASASPSDKPARPGRSSAWRARALAENPGRHRDPSEAESAEEWGLRRIDEAPAHRAEILSCLDFDHCPSHAPSPGVATTLPAPSRGP